MSGSVTPARRPREEDESEVEEYEVPIDGEGSARSSANKRQRLDDEASSDEVSEADNNDLLPDSYRRSPKGNGRAVDGLQNDHAQNEHQHQPGSIVRVTLTNFVTYTKAEFHPGPNLNMIIGPNGTGKSTLVCAICLGLGWATSHLGRAKDLGEFVKHGAKRAIIEIELAADPARHSENQVITTKIVKEGNKAEYSVNGKKSNRKGVQTLARSFSIQVDNLCQFLPQDRVVEFAALSPVDLLTQTQRAAAPEEMSEWHDTLKDMRKAQKRHEIDQQKTVESLKADQNRQRNQEADVVLLRERTDLRQRSAALEKLRPFPEYQAARVKHDAAKARKKEAEKEYRRLERRLEPNLRAVEDKKHYLERIEKSVGMRKRLVGRTEEVVADNKKKIENENAKIENFNTEIEKEKNANKGQKQNIPKYQRELADVVRALQSPPEPFDPAAMNEKIREKTRIIREIEERGEEIKSELSGLKEQRGQRQQTLGRLKQDKENLLSQVGRQASKLRGASKDAAEAWEWIQNNRNAFKSDIYGPAIIECKMSNPQHADMVESAIPDGDKLAFTVTSHEDFEMLQQQLYGTMKLDQINLRNSMQPLSSFHAPISDNDLRRYGLEGWIVDLLDGPEAVRAMLCDNRNIHQSAYAIREPSEDEYATLQRSPINSWVTPTQSYLITRRREYGDLATSTRVQPLKKARFFTDAPVDRQMEDGLDRRINEANGELDLIRQQMQELMSEGTALGERRKLITEEKKAIEGEKAIKQRSLSEYDGLPVKQQRAQEKLDATVASLKSHRERLKAINDKVDDVTAVKGQHCLDYANSVESMRSLHFQLFEVEIIQIEASSDLSQLQAQHSDEERLLNERKREVEQLQEEAQRSLAAGKALEEKCRWLAENITEYETEIQHEITGWEIEQLDTELQSVQARLEMTSGAGGENVLREYDQRAKGIEEKQATLAELGANLESLGTQITEIKDRWEAQLDALVAQISEAFAENFSRIQCAGEVMVHKDDDFENWSIEIRVKFREHEQLSVLDSHRQSGGERAVSTIFYLMALQSLARAPFRVVDEINQGMDPRNERLVHSRMVDIACAEHTSQYFLITPKLLNGLKYHPNMKVHCIASGEFMPEDHRELDFGMLAKKVLALRARSVRVAA